MAYTFQTSTLDGMSYKSTVVSSDNSGTYSKVLILLHGGGSSEAEWTTLIENGSFGTTSSLNNIKFIFPRAKVSGGLWYESNKSSNCANLDDACAYVASSITNNANSLA